MNSNARFFIINPVMGIVMGFLFFEFSSVLTFFSGSDRIFKILGLLFIFFFALMSKKRELTGATKNILNLLFLIEFLMIIIGLFGLSKFYDPFEDSLRNFLRDMLFFTYSPLTLLVPIAAFLSFSPKDLRWMKKVTLFVVIVQIAAVIINWKEIFSGDIMGRTSLITGTGDYLTVRELTSSLFSGVGLVAFFSWNKVYIKMTTYVFIIVGLCFAFIGFSLGGGRGGSFTMLGYILTAILLSNSNSKYRALKIIIFSSILVTLIIYLFNNTSVFSFISSRFFTDDSFSNLRESSREEITAAMISDFASHPLAWFFGRGIYGSYQLPSGGYRQWMEWGFLYQILKGGIIYLIVYVGILLYSFKKAFFNSNNTLFKAMGCLCLWQVLELIPFGLPSMTAQYFLVWWFVGIINRKEMREMNDNEIMYYFNKQ